MVPYGSRALGPVGFGVGAIDYGTRMAVDGIGRRIRSSAERKLEAMYTQASDPRRRQAPRKPTPPNPKRGRYASDVGRPHRPSVDRGPGQFVQDSDRLDRIRFGLNEDGFRFQPSAEIGRSIYDPTTRVLLRKSLKSARLRAKRYSRMKTVRRRRRTVRRRRRNYGFQAI